MQQKFGKGSRHAGLLALLAALCSAGIAAAPTARSILDLQADRQGETIKLAGGGSATLTNLNPKTNAWHLLRLRLDGSDRTYHLENPRPHDQTLSLDAAGGLRLAGATGEASCTLWRGGADSALEQARVTAMPYAPLCDGRLYLRNIVPGAYTRLERVTGLLRDYVWGGEEIVGFVKDELYHDKFVESGAASAQPTGSSNAITPKNLGIDIGDVRQLTPGRWYRVRGAQGIFLSATRADEFESSVKAGGRQAVSALDPVESRAVDYLVGFDLKQFELGYGLGTDHPRLGWSERANSVADRSLPGPDGIDDAGPVARTGMVNPALAPRVAAVFAAGFKREHGAFKYGALATRNAGSHYGFIEEGTVFSTLQPGLATIYVLDDGTLDMKTWTHDDDALIPRIRYARQNGVPILDYDAKRGVTTPGALLTSWGPGNWGGSANEKLRTLRAGLCLQQRAHTRFLVYGYFSTATPSAMARVFESYKCQYAMHLDANALEHTYLALHTHRDGTAVVQHLIDGMEEVDRHAGDRLVPRFLGFPDNRDFFYLVRRQPKA
jgi:hypothetical protein